MDVVFVRNFGHLLLVRSAVVCSGNGIGVSGRAISSVAYMYSVEPVRNLFTYNISYIVENIVLFFPISRFFLIYETQDTRISEDKVHHQPSTHPGEPAGAAAVLIKVARLLNGTLDILLSSRHFIEKRMI